MISVYDVIPTLENEKYILRAIEAKKDLDDLFEVYSDKKSVPFFNSDNCYGETFYFETKERMKQSIDFWDREYSQKKYVRMAIEDRQTGKVIGTIELFNRKANDYFNNCGLLRLDLRSDYEKEESILNILDVIIPRTKELFECEMVATKAINSARERISALLKYGFKLSNHKLIGHDGTEYDYYYIMEF